MSTHNARAAGRSLKTDDTMTSADRQNELERAREANRIHCKETRDRKRERERLLRQVGVCVGRAEVECTSNYYKLFVVDMCVCEYIKE